MENSDMRQKFEAWAKLQGDSCSRVKCCSEHVFRHERYDSAFTEWEWRAYAEGMREGQQQMREKAAQEIGTSWSIESGGWLDSPKAVMAALRALPLSTEAEKGKA